MSRSTHFPMSVSPLGRPVFENEPAVWISAHNEVEDPYSEVAPIPSPATLRTAESPSHTAELDGARWMQSLPTDLQKAPLNTLTIPGSHNSGTFFLDPQQPISADKSQLFQIFASALPRRRIRSWAVCQNVSIYEQLLLGVRYFDLRIARTGMKDPFRIVHGLWGPTLHTLLADVKLFLDEYPYEVVLLDYNHLYRVDSETAFDELVKLTCNILGEERVYRKLKERLPGELSLEWMAARGFRVVVFAEPVLGASELVLQTGAGIESPWANTPCTRRLFQFLEKTHRRPDDRGGRFHVTQAILTPKLKSFARGVFCSLEKQLATRCTAETVLWLQENVGRLGGFNVVMADFVEKEHFCAEVVALNSKK